MTSLNDNKEQKSSSNIPQELIGTWKAQGSANQYEITESGGYYVIDTPKSYTLQDPNTLLWHVTVYTRVYGVPGSLVGVWWSEVQQEEISIRDNNTYSSYGVDGDVYTGTYSATETQIFTTSLYALLRFDGIHMTWVIPYDLPIFGTYEIESPTKWFFRPDDGGEVVYYRD